MRDRNAYKALFIALAATSAISGQTKVDLSTQSKAVDFSQSQFTKPFRTGSALPSTCNVGSIFFLTTASPGQNTYGCTADNTWTLQSGGSTGPAGPTGAGGTIANNGAVVGTRQVLDFSTGQGVLFAISDTGQEISIESMLDTSYVQTRAGTQAGSALLCASPSGSQTTYSCSLTPTLTAYTAGMVLYWKPDVNGIGLPATLNVDLLGGKTLTMADGVTTPGSSNIVAGSLYPVWYDGNVFRILTTTTGTSGSGSGSQGPTGATGATGATGPAGQGYTWRGTWSPSVAYSPYDTVSFGGSSWVSILAGINQEPDVSASYWNLIAAAGSGGSGTSLATWPAGTPYLPFGPMWASAASGYAFPATNGTNPMACAFVPSFNVTFSNWYFSLHTAATLPAGFALALFDASRNLLPNSSMTAYYNSGSSSDLKTAGAKFGPAGAAITLLAGTMYYVAWVSDSTAVTFDDYGIYETTVFNLLNANGGAQCGKSLNLAIGSGATLAMPASLGTLTPTGGGYDLVPYLALR